MLALRSCLLLAWVMGLCCSPSLVLAQGRCEGADADGGACDDDGGAAEDDIDPTGEGDAGASAVDGGPSSGDPDAGSVGRYDECSCDAVVPSDDGTIHVCTESFDPSVCSDFDCERSIVRSRACPRANAVLCCVMDARGTTAQLYDDCDHPNCDSGFREQCRDFGGVVSRGACDQPERPDLIDNSDDGSSSAFCATLAPGAARGQPAHGSSSAAWMCVLGAVLALRRRSAAQAARNSCSPS